MLFLAPFALALTSHFTLTTSHPILTSPASSPLLSPRGPPKCGNNPSITAGSLFPAPPSNPPPSLPPRTPPPIPPPLAHRPGTPTTVWCAPSSRTYVILRVTHLLAGPAIDALLVSALATINTQLAAAGDGVIPGGGLFGASWEGGLVLQTWNANNHQTTWGVLGAALGAVRYYMRVFGYGEVQFGIWDGGNQVGEGSLGVRGGG